MEFPQLGVHCAVSSCSKLDFLPFECDCCHKIFCKEHKGYEDHDCTESYVKDVRVPICPLCDQPVPVKKGEDPNIRVNEHIASDCMEQKKKKLYTNRCSFPGCKKKELVPMLCSACRRNFCIKHRFETSHDCQRPSSSRRTVGKTGGGGGASKAGSSGSKAKPQTTLMSQIGADLNRERQERQRHQGGASAHHPYQSSTQQLSDDEAMAMAIAASLADTTQQQQQQQQQQTRQHHSVAAETVNSQLPAAHNYDEDEALARAVAASLADQESSSQRQQSGQRNSQKSNYEKHSKEDSNCIIS